jgi:hypothetical protein
MTEPTRDDLPVFRCEERGKGEDRRWFFWCPFCKREHAYSPEEGHRVAHCWIGTHFVHGYSMEKR